MAKPVKKRGKPTNEERARRIKLKIQHRQATDVERQWLNGYNEAVANGGKYVKKPKPTNNFNYGNEVPKEDGEADIEIKSALPGSQSDGELPPVSVAGVFDGVKDDSSEPGKAEEPKAKNESQSKDAAKPAEPKTEVPDEVAEQVAGLCTECVKKMSDYCIENGRPGLNDMFINMFFQATKSIVKRSNIEIDPEKADWAIVIGATGWVAGNSYMVYREKKRNEVFSKPKTEEKKSEANGDQNRTGRGPAPREQLTISPTQERIF